MKRLVNWLFRGILSTDITNEEQLEDSIFVVAPDALYVYCNKKCSGELSELYGKVPNVHFYCLSKSDAQNQVLDYIRQCTVGQGGDYQDRAVL